MLRIEVKSNETRTFSGERKKDGKAFELTMQSGWLHGVKEYPVEIEFVLEKGQLPFAPGFYVAGPQCWQIDRGEARLRNVNRMKPERPQLQAAAGK